MMEKKLKIDSEGIIELLGMEFHAFHGCLEQERKEGNTFIVDFLGRRNVRKAAKSDMLEDTADYGTIYRLVASEMEKPSNLLENLAGRIATSIDSARLGFWYIQVRVSKKNPPVGGTCSWSRVTVTNGSDLLSVGDPHSF